MNYTSNYNLKLPERNEQFNIDDWNSNTTAIDSQMKTNATNIATNTTDIATLLTNLTTNKSNDTSSTYFKLMKLIYPVGSIYWSNNSANPSTLFGGTWTQIKDKFVWAKGDSDTVGATGGAKTVTLVTNNLPSHSHTIGGTTGNTQPTFTGTEHSHTYTPAGTIPKHKHTLSIAGTAASSGAHTHRLLVCTGKKRNEISYKYPANTDSTYAGNYTQIVLSGVSNYYDKPDNSWTSYPTIDDTSGYSRYGNWGKQNNDSYKRTLLESDGAHTHPLSFTTNSISEETLTFTGTQATLKATAGGTVQNHNHSLPANTGSTGSATAINKMPPYIVKYCWERTA